MTGTTGRRDRPYPLQPLLTATHLDIGQFAARVQSSHSDVVQAAAEGCTEIRADRWAVRCGFHPAEIWVNWVTEYQPICGTHSGYSSHQRNGEEPCGECKAGHAAYRRQLRAARIAKRRAAA